MSHTVTKAIVRGAAGAVLRVTCSCGDFRSDAARLSTPARRKQDRLLREHLSSVSPDGAVEAML